MGQSGNMEVDGGGGAVENGGIHKMDDTSGAGTDGRRMLSAIFMANKGDGRISDMTEINNAVHAATTNPNDEQPSISTMAEPQHQSESIPVHHDQNPVDDGFPEPDIDVVAETEPQQELPSPDAPDPEMVQEPEPEPEPLPQMEMEPQPQQQPQDEFEFESQPSAEEQSADHSTFEHQPEAQQTDDAPQPLPEEPRQEVMHSNEHPADPQFEAMSH